MGGGAPTVTTTGLPMVADPGSGAAGYYATSRGPTSRAQLGIDWRYPVHKAGSASAERTSAATDENRSIAITGKRVLTAEQAYAEIAGEDRRPLLVMRECLTCTGTDDALLTRNADNEKTMLMSRWFHCVKLPPAVTEESHPYHALFAGEESHLFLARWDGSQRVELDGAQSRVELWKHMEALLASEYTKKHAPALKSLVKTLAQFDELDSQLARLHEQLDSAIEKSGPRFEQGQEDPEEARQVRAGQGRARRACCQGVGPSPPRGGREGARVRLNATAKS